MKKGRLGSVISKINIFRQGGVSLKVHDTGRLPNCIRTTMTIISMVLLLSLTLNRTLKLMSKNHQFFSSTSE